MTDTPFFRLIEERSPEEIAEEMRWAFGPSKGRMEMTISGGELISDEVIPEQVVEAMERMMLTDLGYQAAITNTSPNRLYISKPNPLVPYP